MAEAGDVELDLIAVGAHPDDVEIACGGTLARLVRKGYESGDPKYDFTAVLQAQQTLAQARLAQVQALGNVWRAVSEIAGMLQGFGMPRGNAEAIHEMIVGAGQGLLQWEAGHETVTGNISLDGFVTRLLARSGKG